MSLRRFAVAALAASLFAEFAFAGPRVFEEQARLVPPDSRYTVISSVAIDGDRALVAAQRSIFGENSDVLGAIFEFQRTASGTWQHVATLMLEQSVIHLETGTLAVALKGNVAAASWAQNARIFERTSSGWTTAASFTLPSSVDYGRDVETDGTSVVVSAEQTAIATSHVYRKNSAGQWTEETVLQGSFGEGDVDDFGHDVDLSGSVAVLGNARSLSSTGDSIGNLHIYERVGGSWTSTAQFTDPGSPFFAAATNGDTILASRSEPGIHAVTYRRVGGAWAQAQTLLGDGSFPNRSLLFWNQVDLGTGIAAVGWHENALRGGRTGSVEIFDLASSGSTRAVARLVASDARVNHDLGRGIEVSGRRVIAKSLRAAYIYDVPLDLTQPAIVQDDFQSGNASQWTLLPGSTFMVVGSSNGSLVLRQTSLAGDAGAVNGNTDWDNQSIQARVKPLEFDGTDRWFGLAVRYTDASNYYYLTVRSSNVVQIRRLLNGQFVTLASANLPVALNQTYDLRLEAIGTWIRAYVNGALVAEARDSALTHGRAALRMYKTSAEYDNVVITPNPQNTYYTTPFEESPAFYWQTSGGSWDFPMDGFARVYAQSALDGMARSLTGGNTDDQIIQVRAKATAFAPSGTDRWFGIAGRYTDDNNYYYVTVRNNNQVSLRRLVGGAVTVLDTAPLTVSLDTWYTLRLEIVGDRLRAFVNGEPVLEATDSTLASGRYGLMMYKTATRYDDFTVLQP